MLGIYFHFKVKVLIISITILRIIVINIISEFVNKIKLLTPGT